MEMEDFSKYNGVGTIRHKVQLRLLDLLIAFDKICKDNGISYWIEFGTLLGAVRHKGFIPWDDDIDVCVLNDDYEKLKEHLRKELPDDMVYQDTSTDSYVHTYYGRIRDKKSICYHPAFRLEKEQGLWLDIYRVDRVHSIKAKQLVDFFFRRAFREIHHYGEVTYRSIVKIYCNKVLAHIIYPLCALSVNILRFVGKHSKKTILTRFTVPYNSWDESEIFPLTDIEFEGHLFSAPSRTHEHLMGIYGDYMQLPPEEKREQIVDMDKVIFLN